MAQPLKISNTIQDTPTAPNGSPELLAYRMGQVELALKEGLQDVRGDLRLLRTDFVSRQQLTDVEKQAELVHQDHDSRLKKLEGWNVWLIRLVVGAVILAGLTFVLHSVNVA